MADFYAVTDFDDLRFTTVDEAIKNYLDEVDPPDRWRTLHVKAYRRMRPIVTQDEAWALIEYWMTAWDEDLGDPNLEEPKPFKDEEHEDLVPVAMAFLNQLADRYRAWACEESPSEHVEIDLEQWALRNGYPPGESRPT